MNIEKVKIINDTADLNECEGYERIYFGDEFCQMKMPGIKDLKILISKSSIRKISVVLPYLTDKYFEQATRLAAFISKNPFVFDEIIFNDWGFFYFIRKNYPEIKLALGRLLTKQKTDPFATEIIANKQKITASRHNIFVPKKVSAEAVEYFGETLVNSKIFQKFMVQNNILRIEIDNVNWDINVKLPKNIKASVYYPYVKISTTRFCGYLNMLGENCSKQCRKFSIELKKYRSQYNYIINGNAVVFRNDKLPGIKQMRENCIDRIVFNE
ncbi:MAG: hypothetical protein AB7E39_05985 [Endomicrobiaceae bacterium]